MATFGTLSDRLTETFRNLRTKGKLTPADVDGTVREIRRALLDADVALPVVKEFTAKVRERALGDEVSKALNPANRSTHRIRLNLEPDPRLNLTFDWHLHRALELNNLGANPALATLSSHRLGQEFSLTARYALSRDGFLLGIAPTGRPGKAIRDATPGSDEPWTTVQAHLFWTF